MGMSVPFATKQFEDPDKPIRSMPMRRFRVDKLLASQVDFDMGKVHRMAQKDPDDMGSVPIIGRSGNDRVVLDGHHRLLAAMERGDKYIKGRVV